MLHAASKAGLIVVVAVLALVLGSHAGQKDRPRPVSDELKLFSAKAIEDANAVIAKIKEKHRKDLLIETVQKGVPAKEARQWAIERAKSAGVDGIYIVITLKPKHFEVVVSPKTASLFPEGDREEVVKMIRTKLGTSNDEVLLAIARHVLETMDRRAKPADDFAPLVGEWLGPPVNVTIKVPGGNDVNTKGQLYLRFSEVRGKRLVDLGYLVPSEKDPPRGTFRNCEFEFKQADKERQIVLRSPASVALTYELADDMLKVTASGKIALPEVNEPADLSGAWKRRGDK
ncbi:MAG: hypothetical protein HY289_10830 [Planctomycetes bacterium]|nr:hypothetical protein [Planctomycetota bacterium]